MHPNKHQFPADPRDTHDNEWTPEGLEEFKHWTEVQNDKTEGQKEYLKAASKENPPF